MGRTSARLRGARSREGLIAGWVNRLQKGTAVETEVACFVAQSKTVIRRILRTELMLGD